MFSASGVTPVTDRKRQGFRPRACRLVRRPPIRHAFLLRAATVFRAIAHDPRRMARSFPSVWSLVRHETRATRADLLEGLALVVWCALSRMDLRSLRVGWRVRRRIVEGRVYDFAGLPRATIGRWADLSESTVSRAFGIMRKAGLVDGPGHDGWHVIPQPCERVPVDERHPRGFRGLPAVRRFREEFFAGLGEGPALAFVRSSVSSSPAPAPGAAAALAASSAQVQAARLIATLANAHALERPPDG